MFLVGGMKTTAEAGADLGIFAAVVAAAIRTVDFTQAFFTKWFFFEMSFETIPFAHIGETRDSFLAKHRSALVQAVSLRSSPTVALRRLNQRTIADLYLTEIVAAVQVFLGGSATPDAERCFREALETRLDTLLCALHARPVWFPLINTLPTTTHPNRVVAFATTAPPDRVVDITPFALNHMHHPGTVFVLAALVL